MSPLCQDFEVNAYIKGALNIPLFFSRKILNFIEHFLYIKVFTSSRMFYAYLEMRSNFLKYSGSFWNRPF